MKPMFLFLCVLAAALPLELRAMGDTTVPAVPWYQGTELYAFLSAGYEYNTNDPDLQQNQFHVFDFDDNTMKIDVVELVLKRDPAPGTGGFRVDITAGSSIPRIARSGGLNSGDLDFHQMLASFIVPIGSGLRLDAGKFVTPLGYEVIEGYDGFNDNYTRSILFGYAIPFTHTGLKAGYAVSASTAVGLYLCNGWDIAVDNNRSKTFGAQIQLTPAGGWILGLNAIAGPEQTSNNSDYRKVFDVTAGCMAFPEVTFGANLDYGMEEHAAVNGGTAVWRGAAGYCRWNIGQGWALSIRGEVFDDLHGVRTGVGQTLREVTVTPEYRFSANLIVRGDFRIDNSSRDLFQKSGDLVNSQTTLSVNLMYCMN